MFQTIAVAHELLRIADFGSPSWTGAFAPLTLTLPALPAPIQNLPYPDMCQGSCFPGYTLTSKPAAWYHIFPPYFPGAVPLQLCPMGSGSSFSAPGRGQIDPSSLFVPQWWLRSGRLPNLASDYRRRVLATVTVSKSFLGDIGVKQSPSSGHYVMVEGPTCCGHLVPGEHPA